MKADEVRLYALRGGLKKQAVCYTHFHSNKVFRGDLIAHPTPAGKSEAYTKIRKSVISAQSNINSAVNSTMVQAYWEIGEQIYDLYCLRRKQ